MRKSKIDNYVFSGPFDACLFLIITVISPWISFGTEMFNFSLEHADSFQESALLALFFIGAFFYDFYSRFTNGSYNKVLLGFITAGMVLFGLLGIILIIVLLASFLIVNWANQNKQFAAIITHFFDVIKIVPIYPLLLTAIDFIRLIVKLVMPKFREKSSDSQSASEENNNPLI